MRGITFCFMFENIKKRFSHFFVLGFFSRNSIYKYFYTKIFLRNRYVLVLIGLIFALNFIIWYLWLFRIGNSGFATESYFNFILNVPFLPRFFSLLFIDSFITIINLILAFVIYKKNQFASFVLMFATLFINFFVLALTIFYIVNFNI